VTSLALSSLRRRPWPPILLAAVLAGGASWYAYAQLAPGDRGVPPIDSSSSYEVTGVQVDVAGRTADEARTAAWRMAQRKGWKILWARMHGASPDQAPGVPDSTLDSIVAGIEVESEQVGPHRYIATLGLLFDRGRTGELIGGGTSTPRSAPMLVIPIQYGGGGEQSFESRTSWQKAWARFRTGSSAVDYVRPVGTGADPVLLNLGQSRRPGRIWWRMLLDQYGASDVVVPEVYLERRYPGGPIAARFVARHGPDGEVLGTFTRIASGTGDLDHMLDEGVKQIDALYVNALGRGQLKPDPSLSIEEPEAPAADLIPDDAADPLAAIVEDVSTAQAAQFTVQVETADAATLDQAQAALRAVAGVRQATVASLALGGTSLLSVGYAGEIGALRAALAARGWKLEGEGATLHMRKGGASSTPASATSPPAQPKP
jgi:hypothetical protein